MWKADAPYTREEVIGIINAASADTNSWIALIKMCRHVSGRGLKESRDIIDSAVSYGTNFRVDGTERKIDFNKMLKIFEDLMDDGTGVLPVDNGSVHAEVPTSNIDLKKAVDIEQYNVELERAIDHMLNDYTWSKLGYKKLSDAIKAVLVNFEY